MLVTLTTDGKLSLSKYLYVTGVCSSANVPRLGCGREIITKGTGPWIANSLGLYRVFT